MTKHPYANLPKSAFWHHAVSSRNALEIKNLYQPKFEIKPHDAIATAGSCFAQHFSTALKRRRWNFLDEEPAPHVLSGELAAKNNYGLYSARYGNIYSARQLLQTLRRALGEFSPIDDAWVLHNKLLDPLRPRIEPEGYIDKNELNDARAAHLAAVKRVIENADIFVFTLGLTEAWLNKADGMVYPVCPGTVAGKFDPNLHQFHNFRFYEILDDLCEFFKIARKINPALKFLLTVSPVPLSATASGQHVLSASMAAKSTLRAVCREIVDMYDFVDYFPSYELVASPAFRGQFFEPDMRAVSQFGVDYVMERFFAAHSVAEIPAEAKKFETSAENIQCEEEILKAFAK